MDALKILEGDFALALKDLVNVVLAAAGGNVPLGNVANALGMFEAGRRDERDIAERGAAEAGNDAAAGCARPPSVARTR